MPPSSTTTRPSNGPLTLSPSAHFPLVSETLLVDSRFRRHPSAGAESTARTWASSCAASAASPIPASSSSTEATIPKTDATTTRAAGSPSSASARPERLRPLRPQLAHRAIEAAPVGDREHRQLADGHEHEVALAQREVDVATSQLTEAQVRVDSSRLECVAERRLEVGEEPVDDRHEDRLLAGEVSVHRRASDPRGRADVVHPGRREAPLHEQPSRLVEDHLLADAVLAGVDQEVVGHRPAASSLGDPARRPFPGR